MAEKTQEEQIADVTLEKISEAITVVDCPGYSKIRMGNPNDGGYIVLKEVVEQATELVSYGIGDDVGFEFEFASVNPASSISCIDPRIDKLPLAAPQMRFFKSGFGRGWGGLVTPSTEHPIAKIDVEYDEWSGFMQTPEDVIKAYEMMCIEFHFVFAKRPLDLSPHFTWLYGRAVDDLNLSLLINYGMVLEKLSELFYIFHIHVNNALPPVTMFGHTFPPLLELSLVRKDVVAGVIPTAQEYPTPGLDAPNKTDRLDYALDCFAGVVIKAGISDD
jgi:hypothetical protein